MEYKNLHSYKDFLNERKKFNTEELNEGLLGKLFNFLGKKLKHYYSKLKAAKVIDPIIEDAKNNLKSLYTDKKYIEARNKKIEELKKNTDSENSKADESETKISQSENSESTEQVGESKIYEANTLPDYVANIENTESKDPMIKIMDNFLKNLKEKVKSTLITKDVGVKDGKLTSLTSAYLQLKIFEIEDKIIKDNMEFMKKKSELSEEQANQAFAEATKRNTEATNKLAEMMDKKLAEQNDDTTNNDDVVKGQMNGKYLYHSEDHNTDEKITLIEDQDNITDEGKKKENEENKDNESEKWVKVKAKKSEFYVKKGKLKKIEK